MKRDATLYLRDIIESIEQCERYIARSTKQNFLSNDQMQDAVIRRLEIIGEAAAQASETVRAKMPSVEWRKIVALRNVLIHEYAGVDIEQVWVVCKKQLGPLKKEILNYLERV